MHASYREMNETWNLIAENNLFHVSVDKFIIYNNLEKRVNHFFKNPKKKKPFFWGKEDCFENLPSLKNMVAVAEKKGHIILNSFLTKKRQYTSRKKGGIFLKMEKTIIPFFDERGLNLKNLPPPHKNLRRLWKAVG